MLDVVKVRRLIKDQYGTLFQFGVRLGMDPTQISKYLNGARINLVNARRIAAGLSVPIDDILNHTGTESANA